MRERVACWLLLRVSYDGIRRSGQLVQEIRGIFRRAFVAVTFNPRRSCLYYARAAGLGSIPETQETQEPSHAAVASQRGRTSPTAPKPSADVLPITALHKLAANIWIILQARRPGGFPAPDEMHSCQAAGGVVQGNMQDSRQMQTLER